jgi:diguanylate cyclase (GGDEF)-like protein/PAS domain S-box-containing protein
VSVRLYHWLTFIFIFALANLSAAELKVKQLTVEEGLSQSMVSTMLEDSRGFMWFGTENGLNRYDGHKFDQFFYQSDQLNGLTNNDVTALFEDIRGHIWIGSINGISVYYPTNSSSNMFVQLLDGGSNEILPDNHITSISQDKNGYIWIGTYNGIAVYDMDLNKVKDIQRVSSKQNAILQLLKLKNGNMLSVSISGNILEYDADSFEVTPHLIQETETIYINQVYQDYQGVIWLACRQGLWKKTTKSKIFQQVYFPHTNDSFPEIESLTEDDNGQLWLTASKVGIFNVDFENNRLNAFQKITHNSKLLGSFVVSNSMFDSKGYFWISTMGHGALIWNPDSQIFEPIFYDNNNNDSLYDKVVWSIYESKQGALWVGTESGLYFRDAGQLAFKIYNTDNSIIRSNIIGAIVQYDAKHVLIGTYQGPYLFNIDDHSISYLPQSIADILSESEIYNLARDAAGSIWFSTDENIYEYRVAYDNLLIHQHDPFVSSSIGPYLTGAALKVQKDNVIWIGTDQSLNRFDLVTREFRRYLVTNTKNTDLTASNIADIYFESDNEIWIAYSGNGIVKLELDDNLQVKNKTVLNTITGLPTGSIYSISEANDDFLWISTGTGLLYFSKHDFSYRLFSHHDGLTTNEFNESAYFKSDISGLYLGSIKGLIKVTPNYQQHQKVNPEIGFSGYSVASAKNTQWRPNVPTQIVLSHLQKVITIHFSIFDFWQPKKASYEYLLSNFTTDWLPLNNVHHVSFNNLSPGKYRLSIRGKNQEGTYSPVKHLTLQIMPPPWFSNEAILLYAVLVFALLYVINAFRLRIKKERLEANRQINLFAQAFKHTTEGVIILDKMHRIVAVNSAYTRILGYSEHESINAATAIFQFQNEKDGFFEHIWKTVSFDGQWVGDINEKTKNGKDIVLEISISAAYHPHTNDVENFVVVVSDISDKKKAELELRQLANYDLLTGLPNRTLFQDRLQHAIAHAHRETQQVAILFLDLDRFKQINDSLGHDVGDLLLQSVSKRIHNQIREDDTLARIGGDEFVLILENVEQTQYIAQVAEKIILQFSKPFELNGYQVTSSTSIGISIYPTDGENSNALLKNADTAMYAAKNQGRNNFQFYTKQMNALALERLNLENDLRDSIENQELMLYYQPRVDLNQQKITSLEALVRWNHPKKGMIPPSEFIPIAEDSGLIIPLTYFVLEEACRTLRSWHEAGFNHLKISINLSAIHFQQDDIVQLLQDTADKFFILPSFIEIEITESTIMNNIDYTINLLRKIKSFGFGIAVDDFGTGYSSLSYIQRFPISILKIDRSFVKEVTKSPRGKALVDIVINLAKSLDLTIVAEGVETKSQLQYLFERNCDEIQGFYFARPQPAEDVEKLFGQVFK